jgi:hypothetical protein
MRRDEPLLVSVWHDCTGLLALETGKLGSVHVGVLARLHAMLGEEKGDDGRGA